jgi:hypothetical protein
MSEPTPTQIRYDPKPKEDLKLPPLVRRPYEQTSGSLVKTSDKITPDVAVSLRNIHV